MNSKKQNEFSFSQLGKESIQERIKSLFNGRSLRKVSLDWDIPYSTLNNYFSRSATPSVDVLIKISELEKVSLTWLATGMDGVFAVDECHRSSTEQVHEHLSADTGIEGAKFAFTATPLNDEKFLSLTWSMFFEALNLEEKRKLIDIYAKIGLKGVLSRLSNFTESTNELNSLSPDDKEHSLMINEQLKKGSLGTDRNVGGSDQSSNNKKAG
ncbi:helix-turn-helix domain-containing protein [Buttiauxella noackiae]|uniref:helix-turn-helix domain-containing protein n=1 Tax=Buttiauxella noackiae TaxID=82992 RepID=UPI0028D04934|nr:helix-turn-helix domain-containing protein [Buttiauxella noackiae]